MKKNTNIDYFEENDVKEDITIMSALELSDFIESNINVPGRKSKIKIKELNTMIDEYNKSVGFKAYKRL